MHLPASLLTRFSQGLDEIVPVHVIEENPFALIATAHDVIHGAGILHSQFARHDAKDLDKSNQEVNPESQKYMV